MLSPATRARGSGTVLSQSSRDSLFPTTVVQSAILFLTHYEPCRRCEILRRIDESFSKPGPLPDMGNILQGRRGIYPRWRTDDALGAYNLTPACCCLQRAALPFRLSARSGWLAINRCHPDDSHFVHSPTRQKLMLTPTPHRHLHLQKTAPPTPDQTRNTPCLLRRHRALKLRLRWSSPNRHSTSFPDCPTSGTLAAIRSTPSLAA